MATVRELKATARPKAGKGASRAVRREGRVPGVIYGDNKEPLTISLDQKELRQRIVAGRFLTSLYDIALDGATHRVIPRDYQLDALRDTPMHVDFMRLSAGATIRVRIPVHVKNADQSPGIKRGGAVNIVTHAVEVSCPPESIPDAIEVDLAGLEINHSKHLSDIDLPDDVKPIIAAEELTLVTIVPPSGYAEETKVGADGAAAPAAGAAAPAAGAAAPAAGAKAPAAGAKAPAAGAAKAPAPAAKK